MSAKRSTYRSNNFIRFLSVFLLFVFVQANFIKISHHHNSETETISNNDSKLDLGKIQFKNLAEKCDLCDFIKHQSQEFLSQNIQDIDILKTETFSLSSYFIVSKSHAYLLSCTNKGPPAIISLI